VISRSHEPSSRTIREAAAESVSDAYARILFSKKLGYPLWIPEPSNYTREYEIEGARIGDVGVISFDGQFDFLFNVCLPPDHPVNTLAPPDFEPLDELREGDVRTTREIHSPGCVIASKSIKRETLALGSEQRGDR